MSLKTIGDIQTEFLVRNNLTTTDSYITDQMLKDWTNEAHIFCAGFKKWPFTEGRVSTTFASLATNEDGYLSGSYPEGWKSDSIRLMTIGSYRVNKKNFYKFQQFVEDNPASNDRIFTDYNRIYYVNPRIDLSGTIAVWGQYTPVIDLSLPAEVTVFSNYDEEGNEAMVEKITSYLKRRENLPQEAEAHDARASAKLNEVAEKIKDEQAQYQDTDNDGMFRRFNVVDGGFSDGVNENRF